MKENKAYYDFIKYAIGRSEVVPDSAKSINWNDFLLYCNRQGVTGLVVDGIEKAGIGIDKEILLQWISFETMIEQANLNTNQRLVEVVKFFEKSGRRSCILKGQANGLMYPKPKLRCPGDIDIWVEGNREDIIKSVLKNNPEAHYSIHHIKLPICNDVSVEVHYRPIYLTNWFEDKKLQRYISKNESEQFCNKTTLGDVKIGCLTDKFNAVYQLVHMYDHFFSTRNNLKQFVDYYYLLKRELSQEERVECEIALNEIGIQKYASGIMWIMNSIFGLDSKCLIGLPNEKAGRLILKESNYFGTYSTDNLKYVLEQYIANIRIVKQFPKGVIVGPFFLLWHQWWRLKMMLNMRKQTC